MMRQKRSLASEEERLERRDLLAQSRKEDTAAEDRTIDGMVKRSIELHGP
jgi:hypothetical protein